MVEKVLQFNKEKTIFWTLLGVLFLSLGFYMYCINTTVHNVVMRQNLESEASKLTLDISSKEFQYISLRNTVTLPSAYSMGFKDTYTKKFISRSSSAKVAFLSD
ncbi:MAG: hypothetical protein WAX85_00770 [Minisyncoccia bacterium]